MIHSTNLQITSKSMERRGIDAPLFVLKADGGTMNLSTAEESQWRTILSGPAASFMGINAMLKTDRMPCS